MSTPAHLQPDASRLYGLPSLQTEPRIDTDKRKAHVGEMLAPLAVAVTVATMIGGSAFNKVASLLAGRQAPSSPYTVRQLQDFPRQVMVAPANEQTASQGVSAVGNFVDSQVYEGASSNTAEGAALNLMLKSQGPIEVGKSYEVPVLDPKAFARVEESPNFIVGPVRTATH